MDDKTLFSLRSALAATPGNAELRLVIASALIERGETREAWSLIEEAEESTFDDAQKGQAAEIAVAARRFEEGLGLLDGIEDANSLILRARLLLELERNDEGLDAYRRAVRLNAALEDTNLRDRLSVNVRTFPGPKKVDCDDGRPKLKVYANDQTDNTEVTRLLTPEVESVDFSDVGGLDGIKKQIRKKIILPFQKPSLFQRFKKRVGGGILLYGPPGCGKTLLARATAGECDAHFLNVAISDVLDMYIGESEAKLHALFEKARAETPSVLFFDEIEALGGKRQYSREATSSKLVSQFLAEMDGFAQNNHGVLILGATNVPWAVDPAFRRPGRFDRLLFVPPPDREARRAILDLLLDDRPTTDDLRIAEIAQKTSSFSGADLRNLVESAVDEAIDASIEAGEEMPIRQRHLMMALREVKPTTLEWLTTARNYARYANEGGQYNEVLEFLKKHAK